MPAPADAPGTGCAAGETIRREVGGAGGISCLPSSRRRTQAGATLAAHGAANLGEPGHRAAVSRRRRNGVGLPAACQLAGERMPEPYRVQGTGLGRKIGPGDLRKQVRAATEWAAGAVGRAVARHMEMQSVHGSPRQALTAERKVSRASLVAENAGRPDAVAVEACVADWARQYWKKASSLGASTRGFTVHISLELAKRCRGIPQAARKIPPRVYGVNHVTCRNPPCPCRNAPTAQH